MNYQISLKYSFLPTDQINMGTFCLEISFTTSISSAQELPAQKDSESSSSCLQINCPESSRNGTWVSLKKRTYFSNTDTSFPLRNTSTSIPVSGAFLNPDFCGSLLQFLLTNVKEGNEAVPSLAAWLSTQLHN